MTKKSYAKVNIFLKIAGKREQYHELVSRFMRVENLFDTIEFKEQCVDRFTLQGDFSCTLEKNTLYKAYLALSNYSNKVTHYFKSHSVHVTKRIPEFAGLGGGSSNCASFMLMVNEVCRLGLSKDTLAKIGATIGADVPFFIYEYTSANVTGIGEIVEPFEEDILDIITFTPNIQCDTGAIFRSFRENHYKEITPKESKKLLNQNSIDIYNTMTIKEANDLYEPALENYSKLLPENYSLPSKSFFSGSGSSFFYLN